MPSFSGESGVRGQVLLADSGETVSDSSRHSGLADLVVARAQPWSEKQREEHASPGAPASILTRWWARELTVPPIGTVGDEEVEMAVGSPEPLVMAVGFQGTGPIAGRLLSQRERWVKTNCR